MRLARCSATRGALHRLSSPQGARIRAQGPARDGRRARAGDLNALHRRLSESGRGSSSRWRRRVDEDGSAHQSAQLRCTVVWQLHVWRRAGERPLRSCWRACQPLESRWTASGHDRRIDRPSPRLWVATLSRIMRCPCAETASRSGSSYAREAARHTRSVHVRRVRPMWLSLADQSAG